MTECERLIANGTFTRDFFKPEVRCDFLVEEKRKKIWAVEIDLMLQFDKVCKKHGLRYCLDGGSMLGAVRHHGFIPWDDDVDVAMPRSDYEKFLTLGNEFKEPYFLQTPYSDPEYFYAFARLRNSNTIYLSEVFRYQKINHGIPLDIFPYDEHVIRTDSAATFQSIMDEIVLNSTFMRMKHPHLDEKNRKRVQEYPGGDPLARYELIQKMCRRDEGRNDVDSLWCPPGGVYGYERSRFACNLFDYMIELDFEQYKFPVPQGFNEYLSSVYGDFMKLPPKEKRYPWYGADYFDADVSYREHLQL